MAVVDCARLADLRKALIRVLHLWPHTVPAQTAPLPWSERMNSPTAAGGGSTETPTETPRYTSRYTCPRRASTPVPSPSTRPIAAPCTARPEPSREWTPGKVRINDEAVRGQDELAREIVVHVECRAVPLDELDHARERHDSLVRLRPDEGSVPRQSREEHGCLHRQWPVDRGPAYLEPWSCQRPLHDREGRRPEDHFDIEAQALSRDQHIVGNGRRHVGSADLETS